MGEVYLAEDLQLNRASCDQIFAAGNFRIDANATKRFLREAQVRRRAFDIRNICTIHEIGEQDRVLVLS